MKIERKFDFLQNFRYNEIANIKSPVTDLMNPVDESIYRPQTFRIQWNPCDAFLISAFLEKEKAVRKSKECLATVELNGEMTRGQLVICHMTGSPNNFNVTMIEQVNSDICKEMLLWTASP